MELFFCIFSLGNRHPIPKMESVLLCLIFFFSYLNSGQDYIDYPHPFHPTSSKNGMVVSQNSLSSDIGIEIQDMGGNAVDAAVAVGFSLATTLPRAGNLGGGGFMLIYIYMVTL